MTGLLASERERGKGSCAMETAVGGTGVDDGDTTVNYDGDGDVSSLNGEIMECSSDLVGVSRWGLGDWA